MKIDNENRELIAIYLNNGLTLDYELTDKINPYQNNQLITEFKTNPYKALFYFGFIDDTQDMSPSLIFIHRICHQFIRALSENPTIEFTHSMPKLSADESLALLHSVPFALGVEHINIIWIQTIWQALSAVFEAEIKNHTGTLETFLHANNPKMKVMGRVYFHLVENKSTEYPFAFLATYSTDQNNEKTSAHVPLKHALLEYKDQTESLLKLLATVSRAAEQSELISELVESGELFSPLHFSANEAYTFLKEITLYESCGILCRIPDWWKKKTNALKLSIAIGEKPPSTVGMAALLNFNPSLFFGDESFTKAEIEALLAQTAGLSFLKGKWVEVDHAKLEAILTMYNKVHKLAEEGHLTLADAIRMQLNVNDTLGIDIPDLNIEVAHGEWLGHIRNLLTHPTEIKHLSAGNDFKATLRHYQQTGFDWLATMKNLGLGALLADDMGLGKTVQILALLEYLRNNNGIKSLLILPASLIGNWEKEIEKFAPQLKYSVLHTKNVELELESSDLFITTYGMALRISALQVPQWDLVILDEAQAIKNPATKQTKIIKQLKSHFKIAMTGTPIENRLSDLWSIFDFLNSGLLGTAKEFSNLIKTTNGAENYDKIRNAISPFILRRLKTDKTVISDLPDKIETKAYASLSKKQVILYNSLVKELERKLTNAEGIERKGLVLASIIKFKQICNHPDQYLAQQDYAAEHSGKFAKLAELCETIHEKRERVLIFTQFKEMTAPIANYLENIFGRQGLILHGGTSVKKRTELVTQFCGEDYIPFMVLSLKAGGVGLNLTSANHVIHFDRWWNPAVENQATDRAFRIGQTKDVMVHKFITIGTIEEKIEQMLEEKQKLAGDIIMSSGEGWISNMNNDELMQLVTLM